MQGASRESLSTATERLDGLLASPITEAGDVAERATHWVGRFMPSVAQRVESVLPVSGPWASATPSSPWPRCSTASRPCGAR